MNLKSYYEMIYKKLVSGEKYAKHIGVKIGNGCKIATKFFSSEPYLIEIGNNVRIAPEVLILTHGGFVSVRNLYPELDDFDYFGRVKIGDNSYIGQRSIIMPGVEIGENCVIGAMSVVNKSIPDNTFAAGNPIKYISSTNEMVERMKKFNVHTKGLMNEEKKDILLKLDEKKFVKKNVLTIKK